MIRVHRRTVDMEGNLIMTDEKREEICKAIDSIVLPIKANGGDLLEGKPDDFKSTFEDIQRTSQIFKHCADVIRRLIIRHIQRYAMDLYMANAWKVWKDTGLPNANLRRVAALAANKLLDHDSEIAKICGLKKEDWDKVEEMQREALEADINDCND